jgi:lysophospholipase L1-like esterase
MWFAALAWIVALFALGTAHPSSAPALISKAGPLRVMALGDSITAGVGSGGARADDGGYRGVLAARLQSSGYHVTFVGSRTDYSSAIAERAHEGWPGYVVRSFPSDPGPGQLIGSLTRRAMQTNDPDVVLLMAGTNDLLRLQKRAAGYTLPSILQSVDLLLDQIVTAKPSVFVIVAPVVESPKIDACDLRAFAGRAGCGDATESLKTIVEAYVQRGYRISLAADMATAVPRDAAHFPDGIHPCGTGGYELVADVWLHAIEEITQVDETSVAIGSAQHR